VCPGISHGISTKTSFPHLRSAQKLAAHSKCALRWPAAHPKCTLRFFGSFGRPPPGVLYNAIPYGLRGYAVPCYSPCLEFLTPFLGRVSYENCGAGTCMFFIRFPPPRTPTGSAAMRRGCTKVRQGQGFCCFGRALMQRRNRVHSGYSRRSRLYSKCARFLRCIREHPKQQNPWLWRSLAQPLRIAADPAGVRGGPNRPQNWDLPAPHCFA
jgi:hypothetical protein